MTVPTVVRDGVTIYFSDAGEGPPILLHTGGGGDGRMWELGGYTAALPGYRHILVDHRGHGRSDAPRDVVAHRMEEYVADVVAVLDAAKVGSAAFIGYSGGASVGYRFAAAHPERCHALVVLGSAPEPEDDSATNLAFAEDIRKAGMRSAMEQMSASESEPAPAWLVDHLSTTETEMFALMLEGWSRGEEAWDLLPRIAAPTLMICGEREVEPAAVHRAAQRLRLGRAEVLPGFGHLQAFWHSEVTAPLMREFLDGIAGKSLAG